VKTAQKISVDVRTLDEGNNNAVPEQLGKEAIRTALGQREGRNRDPSQFCCNAVSEATPHST
jgi:hypothetical protein